MAKIFPLSDGLFTVGHDKQFVPFDEETDDLSVRPKGSLLLQVQPFFVVTHKDLIVFDTGLGFSNSAGELRIHANLHALGYAPGAVTKVLMSHLHKDHAGCMVYTDNYGTQKTTFPNADYYIYRPEVEYALSTGSPSYITSDIEPVLMTDQVQWLDGERGTIDGYIQFTHSGGHCPQHVVYLIDDGMDKVFFGGDEAPQLKQMKMKYVAKYDYDGKKAMMLREQYAAQGKEEGWQFLFYHDFKNPVARM